MKKVFIPILTILLSTSAIAEDTDFYFGVDIFKGYNTYTYDSNIQPDYDRDNDSNGIRLKFGADLDDAWKVQGHFTIEDFDKNNFSQYGSDGNLYELGVDVIKGLPLENNLIPFVSAGINFGAMEVNGYTDDTISSFGLKVGAGISYLFTPELEGVIGVDLKFRTWETIEGYVGATYVEIETTERIFSPYLGLNYHF